MDFQDIFSGFVGSAITSVIALILWYLKEKAQIKLYVSKQIAQNKIESLKESHGERFLYNKFIKERLDLLVNDFEASNVFVGKFHNGEVYTDKKHIMKWSIFLESYSDLKHSVKENLQNRSTTDTPKFFGDLKEYGYSFANDTDNIKCDGWRVLINSLKMKSYIAAIQESKDDVKAFVVVLFKNKPKEEINADKSKQLIQGLNSFSDYI
jgi:hypothetical protein